MIEALKQAPGVTKFAFDAVNDIPFSPPPPMPIRIASTVPITLRGWAVDASNNTIAGGVIVVVDDSQRYQATYGGERNDVAAVLGNPEYRYSGFSITFPAGILSSGRHILSIAILTHDSEGCYQPDQKIDLDIATG
jgi:hypothetical protein